MESLINVLLGVVGSLVAWWILFRVYVPKISFSTGVCRTPTDDSQSKTMYRIKIENSGYRPIVDVDVFARVFIKGLRELTPENYTVVRLNVSSGKIPTIHRNRQKIIRIHPETTTSFQSQKYPPYIQEKAGNKTLLLEELLALGTESYMTLTVFGYDDFSGARKVFESVSYNLKDIKVGLFKKKSLTINEISEWHEGHDGNDTTKVVANQVATKRAGGAAGSDQVKLLKS